MISVFHVLLGVLSGLALEPALMSDDGWAGVLSPESCAVQQSDIVYVYRDRRIWHCDTSFISDSKVNWSVGDSSFALPIGAVLDQVCIELGDPQTCAPCFVKPQLPGSPSESGVSSVCPMVLAPHGVAVVRESDAGAQVDWVLFDAQGCVCGELEMGSAKDLDPSTDVSNERLGGAASGGMELRSFRARRWRVRALLEMQGDWGLRQGRGRNGGDLSRLRWSSGARWSGRIALQLRY